MRRSKMLKKMIRQILFVIPVSMVSLGASLQAAPYIQLASTKDQLVSAGSENQPMVVMMDSQDGMAGIGWDPSKNEITVQEDGLYFVMAVAQIGKRDMPTAPTQAGEIFFWYEVNGAPVQDGGNWIVSSPASPAKTIVDQMATPLKAGDKLVCKFTSSTAQYGLIAYSATNMRANAPGITFTMYKIGE